MRLVNINPKTLIGRTIGDHLGHWWEVAGVESDHLFLKKSWRNETGKLRLAMLPRCRLYPSHSEVERRYPLLLRALRWGAILTQGEAVGAVQGYLINGNHAGSEAVAHIGGAVAAIRQAWRCRHATRELHARERRAA